ncbi:hypothetical protein PIROE2DRAFT_18543 [Piromyces sp. E2]|nr:hypothetical protein PIROE2DRAFT_18543 [Piromyces sp. E2]|eukprot:OUM56720.1 hypothetical protein PIROE2DRAFT_18543 [Piromyces sp. E2]
MGNLILKVKKKNNNNFLNITKFNNIKVKVLIILNGNNSKCNDKCNDNTKW